MSHCKEENNIPSDINAAEQEQTGAKKKFSFFELNLKLKNKINTDYAEYDAQKGDLSPRLLFRKRKPDQDLNIKMSSYNNYYNNIEEKPSIPKTVNKIKNHFENYLDLVHDSYFAYNEAELDTNDIKTFKFSSLDLLINPLRQKFIFETWSPYDIALFECCVCKFGKNFDIYTKVIKGKTKDDIVNFYYYWKQSKYYTVWKNNRFRKIKPVK
jgi:hypothetical protein